MNLSLNKLQIMTASLAVIFTLGAQAEVPQGYYSSLEGKCGVTLKKAVKAVARNHTAISYGDKTWEVFRSSDTHMVGGQLVWWDMYSSDNVPVSSGHPGLNIEHSVPNSWWGKTKNDAYKDLHHLNPSNSTANSSKGNFPLAEIADITWDNGVTFVGIPKSGQGGGANRVYEPADEYKGDFARAYFYMFTIYDDINWSDKWEWMYDTSSDLLLRPWAYELLLRWAADDPVSQKEIDRNEAVAKAQKNRNPFIDCPDLAEHIWGAKRNEGFVYDPSYVPDPDDPETPTPPVVDPDDPQPPLPADGEWTLVASMSDINADFDYIIVSAEKGEAMSCSLSNPDGGYLSKTDVSPVISGKTLTFSIIPEDLAVVSFSGSAMSVRNPAGRNFGYLVCETSKKMKYSSTPANVSISFTGESVEISFGSSTGTLQYNASAPRFTTYTSSQEDLKLYRRSRTTNHLVMTPSDDSPSDMRIFDLSGREINGTPAPGIYIIVSGGNTSKMVIR